jgi:hypothetical protein
MPYVWNASYPDPNITGFYPMMDYANTVTSGAFGMGLMLGIFATFYIIFRRYGDMEAFATSSFIATVLGGILRSGNMIADWVFVLFIMMTGISIVLMWRRTT